jgi:6-pyruvoyltetrahydropterin/6-carboxytetrahydropterin synthase
LDAVTRVQLTRMVRFAAAHRYFRPEWSADRNAEEFGRCASEHGHGHNYECRVTVSGRPADDTSMVIRLDQLDEILREEVTERFDHRHINYEVPEFGFGKEIPTVEALAVHIWKSLRRRLPPAVDLECVRVQEDPCLFAEYRGED